MSGKKKMGQLSATIDTKHRHQISNKRVFELIEIISRENDWSNDISWNLKDIDVFLFLGNQSELYRLTTPLHFEYYFKLRIQFHY